MDNTLEVRASDADCERVVDALRAQVGTGRLTLDEFSERAARAYRARTMGDLATLTRDLPKPMPVASHPTHGRNASASAALIAAIALLVLFGVVALFWMTAAMQHMGPMMGR